MLKLVGALGLLLVAGYLIRGGTPADLSKLIVDMLGTAWNGIAQHGVSIPASTPGGTP